MTIDMLEFLKIELYIVLIVLIIILVILGIKLIKTLSKVDKVIDDVNDKLDKVDGAFNVVGKTADYVDSVSDKLANFVITLVGRFINKKKGNDFDE